MALARLEALKKSLENATRLLRELEAQGTLIYLADQDERRWGPVVDSAFHALEDRMGTVARLLKDLKAATEDEDSPTKNAALTDQQIRRQVPDSWLGPEGIGRG